MSKPILFNTDMVRASLDGRKTVTRRVIKLQPKYSVQDGFSWKGATYGTDLPPTVKGAAHNFVCACPYQPGDILYVRETWHKYTKRVGTGERCHMSDFYGYKASIANSEDAEERWKPSIHMPKEAARLWLKVTDVRAERLQDMSHDAPMKEGIHFCECPDGFTWKEHTDMQNCYLNPMGAMKALWNSTIKKKDLPLYGWNANPWVWVIEFERCEKSEEV